MIKIHDNSCFNKDWRLFERDDILLDIPDPEMQRLASLLWLKNVRKRANKLARFARPIMRSYKVELPYSRRSIQ